jgi:hypothetical protein
MKKTLILLCFAFLCIISPILSNTVFAALGEASLLTQPWQFTGNSNASEKYQSISSTILNGYDSLRIVYNLHGVCLLGGDASAIIFDQNGWKYVSLSDYGNNCLDGEQTITIPLKNFKDSSTGVVLDSSKPLTGSIHARIWYGSSFTVDISSITATSSSGTALPTPVVLPTPTSTPTPTLIPTAVPTPTPTPLPVVGSPTPTPTPPTGGTEILQTPWTLSSSSGGSKEKRQSVSKTVLLGQSSVAITYNLHGLCLLGGDASAIIFDQNGWKYVSLSKYGKNCFTGIQTVTIPLSDFKASSKNIPLDTTKPIDGTFHVRFWYNKAFTVDITSVRVLGSIVLSPTPTITVMPTPTATPSPTLIPTPTPTVGLPTPTPTGGSTPIGSWAIQSVDAMKYTKDAICGQRSEDWINQWVAKAVEVGANYVAISTPYDNPSCGNSVAYTNLWIKVIRAHGLKVWHRQMPLSFEGIYSVTKNNSSNYLSLIQNYITQHPDMYADGDIFTPIPEPQNGGIAGVTYCAQNVCQFSSKEQFNQWLRDAMTISKQAFTSLGKNNIKIGYFGFDGFVAWGDNNPDWTGILEDATVTQMGNITIDHYPELVGDTMANDLQELQVRYPGVDIIIGEWGTVTGVNTPQQVANSMGAAVLPNVKGFNYWQFGPGGAGEQLLNDDFTNAAQFSAVQKFFKP